MKVQPGWLLLICALAAALPLRAQQPDRLAAALACRQEPSPLLRLDCYDGALADNVTPVAQPGGKAGVAWQRAMNHERQRHERDTAFLVTAGSGDNPQVILTTPALGVPPPRPVLMFSCVDNITRMQVAMQTPLRETDGAVTLLADSTRFSAAWFVRENGFLLESSRGLAGIAEIKRLYGAEQLTLTTPGEANRLVFNIHGLAQALAPLRSACRW